MSAYVKQQSPQEQSYPARLPSPQQVIDPQQPAPNYGSYQQQSATYQPQQPSQPQHSSSSPTSYTKPSQPQQSRNDSRNTNDPVEQTAQTLSVADSSHGDQSNNDYGSDTASMPMPQIVGSYPSQGPKGGQFTILLSSSVDLTRDQRSFKIMFGSRRCNTDIQKQNDANGYPQYALTTSVPSMSLTGWFGSNKVSVYMNVEDEQGQELSTEHVSDYIYTDVSPPQAYTMSPPLGSRKRKVSPGAEDARNDRSRSPPRRPSGLLDMRPKSDDYSYSYPTATTAAPYSSYMPQSAGSERSFESMYGDRHDNDSYKHRPMSAIYSSPSFNFRPRSELPAYPQSTSSQAWPNMYSVTSSPGLPGMPPSGPAHLGATSTPTDPSNPSLVRTSTLQQSSQSPQSAGGAPFNPYAVYPNRALLKLSGNLDAMAEYWSEEEWHNRRRLVQFWRNQKGNAINASFAPVSQSERQSNSICISCIWWAEKNAAYVTSVDCIYLLESLIAVRFTVEEKNRIRRNLEGFHPLTVSKAKADSENFFKLIMGFPNPKPRNIEKDVKVFPWKILSMALKKIIGKYSASYSSTASALPAVHPPSSYPAPLSLQRVSSDEGRSASPRSLSDSTSSPLPHSNHHYGTPPPGLKGLPPPPPPSHLQHRGSHIPMLGNPLPPSSVVGGHWHHPPAGHTLPQPPPPPPPQHPRNSWELGAGLPGFLDTNNGGPHSAGPPQQNLQYHHNSANSDVTSMHRPKGHAIHHGP